MKWELERLCYHVTLILDSLGYYGIFCFLYLTGAKSLPGVEELLT